ncbi:MAG: transcription elongation factor GreA [Candidatus Pacebacteria bacterium]|jgi:transcription elongation factor GreA|nr:transcription elongation factor GreA [Candidatus Paceibacterota bacterium]MDD4994617.1 transcription elongation factor GreA [Candidatus Paceibacterota bacterium]MDD5535263.1 transcription elongation factor GreA [Candidatus Paceibacterota bacterium]
MEKNYVTAETYKALKEELKELKTVKRQEIAQMLQEAKELGDLSENAAYQEAKDSQEALETRILELESFFKNASIIRRSPYNNGKVELGSTIELQNVNKPTVKRIFTIVGSQEADPVKGRISNESPLGRAFLGHTKEEIVLVKTPQGEVKYKILNIS